MPDTPKIWEWSIYKIVNPKNRVYIGITTDLPKRIKHYQRADCRNQQALFHSLKKYGFSEHTFEVIETFTSNKDFAMEREIYWISYYKCNYSQLPKENGLNLTGGGRGSHGRVMTDETKQKLRQANLGKKYSDETKAKLSAMKKGKKIKSGWTEEKKAKMRVIKLNFRHTEDAKKRIGEGAKGNKYCVGKKLSEERKKQIGEFHKGHKYNLGKKHSPEHNAKITAHKYKPIYQYTLSGEFVKEYPSVQDAVNKTGLSKASISGSAKGRVSNPRKYIFKYKKGIEFHKFQFQRRVFNLTA